MRTAKYPKFIVRHLNLPGAIVRIAAETVSSPKPLMLFGAEHDITCRALPQTESTNQ